MIKSPALSYSRANSGLTFRPDASTVLWLPGQDDAQSATIRDRSGYGNHGTITGATWARTPKGLWYLSYDGIDDQTLIAYNASLDTGLNSFSLVVWWERHADIGANTKFMATRPGVGGNGWQAYTALVTRFGFQSDSGGWTSYTGTESLSTTNWQMITIVVTGRTALQFYLNSTPDTATLDTGLDITNHGTWDANRDLYLGIMLGGVDPASHDQALARIFRGVALTATQVANIYSQERHLFGV